MDLVNERTCRVVDVFQVETTSSGLGQGSWPRKATIQGEQSGLSRLAGLYTRDSHVEFLFLMEPAGRWRIVIRST